MPSYKELWSPHKWDSFHHCNHVHMNEDSHLNICPHLMLYSSITRWVYNYKVKCSHNGTIPLIIIHVGWILSTTDLKPYTPHNVLLTLWVFILFSALSYTIHLRSYCTNNHGSWHKQIRRPHWGLGLHCWCGMCHHSEIRETLHENQVFDSPINWDLGVVNTNNGIARGSSPCVTLFLGLHSLGPRLVFAQPSLMPEELQDISSMEFIYMVPEGLLCMLCQLYM